jgi:hypothetical protein
MIYYSSFGTQEVKDFISDKDYMGAIITPSKFNVRDDWDVIADNGCFSKKWNENVWLKWVENLAEKEIPLRFVVCPDVVDLSGKSETHWETLDLWDKWSPVIRDFGFEPCFVLQRGAKYDNIPTDTDYFFIGGDTAFKLGLDVQEICYHFYENKWIHMGRVNSLKRLRVAKKFGCKSADGTTLAIAPKNRFRIEEWFNTLDGKSYKPKRVVRIDKPNVSDPSVKIRTISYGGGVQSTAMCVLATQGKLDDIMGGPIDAAVFANVGDDSEHPDTIEYVNNIMMPWAKANGLNIVEVQKTRYGKPTTLLETIINQETSIPIPIKLFNGAPGARSCTSEFKIRTINKWIKSQGISAKMQHGSRNSGSKISLEIANNIRERYASEKISVRKLAEEYEISKSQISDIINGKYWNPDIEDTFAAVAIGISTDEIYRINRKSEELHEIVVYPLIELGLSRTDCEKIISDAGLPVPSKSACFFCPFHGKDYWRDLKNNRYDLWETSVKIENVLNDKRKKTGKDEVFMFKAGVRLENLFDDEFEQLDVFGNSVVLKSEESFNDGKCDEGYCWI